MYNLSDYVDSCYYQESTCKCCEEKNDLKFECEAYLRELVKQAFGVVSLDVEYFRECTLALARYYDMDDVIEICKSNEFVLVEKTV